MEFEKMVPFFGRIVFILKRGLEHTEKVYLQQIHKAIVFASTQVLESCLLTL